MDVYQHDSVLLTNARAPGPRQDRVNSVGAAGDRARCDGGVIRKGRNTGQFRGFDRRRWLGRSVALRSAARDKFPLRP